MKRIFVLLLSILFLLLFASITFGQKEQTKQTKKPTTQTSTVTPKTTTVNPSKPGQPVKPNKENVFDPGGWGAKNKKPLDGKGTDIVKPEKDPVILGGFDGVQQNKDKFNQQTGNRAASGLPTGKRQVRGNQLGVNKVSPDVIDPVDGEAKDKDPKVKPNNEGVFHPGGWGVKPNNRANQNIKPIDPANEQVKPNTQTIDPKTKSSNQKKNNKGKK
jgi:hypothetical protein